MDRNGWIGIALVGWFVLLAVAEAAFARREAAANEGDARLLTNFTLTILVVLAGAAVPLASVSASVIAERLDIGLARNVPMSWFAVFALTLVAQSFAGYWVHRTMHAAPLLWRVHRVHHADSAVDVSTSFRNHPLELLATLPVSALVVLLTGASASVVVAAQTVLAAAALWQHADLALPSRLERALASIIVTPRVHRLHHSPERATHDSNYGELITLWDRLFGTFNPSEERCAVGLRDQASHPDRLFEQIVSPVRPV